MDKFQYAHEHADEIVWMSQNTNHIPLSPKIEEAILEAIRSREYNLYPYSKGVDGLPEAILKDLDLGGGWDVIVTNGGIEALYILNRALLSEGDEVIATDPSFMPIHHQIRLSGANPVELPIYKEPWKMTPEAIRAAITPKTKMILLIDPINPVGTAYTRGEVKEICEIAREHDLYIIDDITYRDFSPDHTLTSEFYPEKSIIVYSFSKTSAFAGMRIGALIAPKELMEKMRPYNTNVLSVNILAQRGALASLETKGEWLDRMLKTAMRSQEIVKEAVDEEGGAFIPVFPSRTNMLIIDISALGIDGDELEHRMLYGDGVFIRGGSYLSPRFGKNFIRVSFTVPNDGAERFKESFVKQIAAMGK